MEMLLDRTDKLILGDGLLSKTEVGPMINSGQRDTVDSYVQIGLEEGAKLEIGGKTVKEGDLSKGWFYKPTIFSSVKPEMRIAKEEIFGPVLSVLKVSSFEEAIKVLNNTEYGLSSSIYTQNINDAFKAIRDIQCGITYINGPTIGAEAHMPFGGMKNTGNGHREGGWSVYDFFSETKVAYIDFSGKLQRAQIDNY
jgi:aldehyde dehydrogenase (NAD+)